MGSSAIADPPRGLVETPEEVAAWRAVWPRAIAASGFDARIDGLALGLLVCEYVKYRSAFDQASTEVHEPHRLVLQKIAEEYQQSARAMAWRLKLLEGRTKHLARLDDRAYDAQLGALFE